MDSLWIAIQITAVGMALVFGAIVVLWGLMVLLVNVTGRMEDARAVAVPAVAEHGDDEQALKQQAAAVAVALALAVQDSGGAPEFPLPRRAPMSGWQTSMRATEARKREQER